MLDPNTIIALKAAIDNYDQNIDNLKSEIARGTAAGINMQEQRNAVNELENTVRKIRTQYSRELAA